MSTGAAPWYYFRIVNHSTRTIHIGIASLISVLLIGSAYIFSGPNAILAFFHIAEAQSSEALLKAYAAKDTDSDGLPDWQEALYNTDPANPTSFKAGVQDGDAVAQGLIKPKFQSQVATTSAVAYTPVIPGSSPASDSLTDQFAQEFFQSYMEVSGGQALSDQDQATLVSNLLASFTAKAQKLIVSPYTSISVHTSATVTVSAYAGSVEQVIAGNDAPGVDGDFLTLAQALIENGDETARPKLKKLAASYAAIAVGLAQVQVPPALANDHLQLMQTFDTVARATKLVVTYEKDPVATLGAIAVYQPAADTMIATIQDIAAAILATGEPAPEAPGASLVNFARSLQSQ